MTRTAAPSAPVTWVTRRTRVMSCRATILVVVDARTEAAADPDELAEWAAARLDELERRWSRFLPTSEISELNAAAGQARRVSPDTVRLVTALVSAWHQTGGAFDPTLLGSLVELGYAASRDDVERRTSLAPDVSLRGRPDAVLVDTVHHVVQLPAGTALDPGGLGKGLAADIVVDELLDAGAAGALVEIGGDLRVAGRPPAEGWTIDVDVALAERAVVRLLDGGVATSTSRLRTWQVAGEQRHHLIDPVTLRPSTADAVSCTVIGGSGATAEAFTKVAFAGGADAAIELCERHGLAASVTTAAGERLTTTTWGAYEVDRPPSSPPTSPATEHPR